MHTYIHIYIYTYTRKVSKDNDVDAHGNVESQNWDSSFPSPSRHTMDHVPGHFADEVKEWFFKVVVRLGRHIIVLQVLAAVKHDLFGLNLTVLHIHLVADQHDGDVFAHTGQITVPCRHILVRDARGDIKHDDGCLTTDVVAVAQTAKFLLASCVPAIGHDGSARCEKGNGVDLHTHGG
jgi:hypothetical protein